MYPLSVWLTRRKPVPKRSIPLQLLLVPSAAPATSHLLPGELQEEASKHWNRSPQLIFFLSGDSREDALVTVSILLSSLHNSKLKTLSFLLCSLSPSPPSLW